MTFNWIPDGTPDDTFTRRCIELEYRLRPRITRFLLERLGPEHKDDFSIFHFDVDFKRREIRISKETPREYLPKIALDFMKEIGVGCC